MEFWGVSGPLAFALEGGFWGSITGKILLSLGAKGCICRLILLEGLDRVLSDEDWRSGGAALPGTCSSVYTHSVKSGQFLDLGTAYL